ncbi:MAG: xanthine dehydrogenase family protein subunit M [Deltaproteobacteria bacterium]|nr:xanthine dehydrogenase family protein subunit M [Deltaproteobacteria bacterium]
MSDYLRPASLAQAVHYRREHPDYLVIAGGTDLMVGSRERPEPAGLIDLFGLAELCGIEKRDTALWIGAATPYAEVLRSPLVARHAPMLSESVREIGAVQIQARGTLGGNLVTSSPVGDTLPVLLALDATVALVSWRGERVVPYREFCVGYRRTQLAPDELVTCVRIPRPAAQSHQLWRKVGTRRAQAISKVMLAAYAELDRQGRVSTARMALGAVADRPLRIAAAEAALAGRKPNTRTAALVKAAVESAITPIDDVRSTADYRRTVAGNLAARFVLSLVEP